MQETGRGFKGVDSPGCYRLSRETEVLDVVSLQNRCDMIFLSSAFCPNSLDLMILKIEATISHVCTTLSGRRP